MHNDLVCLLSKSGQAIKEFRAITEVVESGEWHGVHIYKEKPVAGVHNPISVQDVINTLNYFHLPPDDVSGMMAIVIAGRDPYSDELQSGWAFGAYQIIWEEKHKTREDGSKKIEKVPRENRLMLWAQKMDKVRFNLGGEIRESYYYRVQPVYNGQVVDRYISTQALRREILGDTLIHEIGHHVDLWHYGRYIANDTDRARAEKYAEAYALAHTKKTRDMPEFATIIDGTYQAATPEPDNAEQQTSQQEVKQP